MKKIENYNLPDHINSLYEKEASSAIGLVREIAIKINELIDNYNELSKGDLEWKQKQEGTIRKGIIYMKDNLLNSIQEIYNILQQQGFIDKRIAEHTRSLSQRLNNLLGSIQEGSTSADAELIDARMGADNVIYNTLGDAGREQLKKLEAMISEAYLALGYENFYAGGTITGWVTPTGFVTVEGFARSTPVYLNKGTYVTNTVVATFSEGHGEMCAKVNSVGDVLRLITGTPNATDSLALFELDEAGWYSFNIGRTEFAPTFMICACDSFEKFPSQYLPHSTPIVSEGVKLNETMKEEIAEILRSSVGSVYVENKLHGKKVVFDGDSICEGDSESGWAGRIGRKNNMVWTNEGVSGGTITAGVLTQSGNTRHSVATNLDKIIALHSDLDYLILEGGTNDADLILDRLGTISTNKCLHTDFNPSADFTQALEYTLSKAIATFPTKKIGFIVAHKMANESGYSNSNRRKFFDRCVEVCKKYGIPCLDLWNTAHLWGPIDRASNNGNYLMYTDGQHLSGAGYDYISDIIEAWMRTI